MESGRQLIPVPEQFQLLQLKLIRLHDGTPMETNGLLFEFQLLQLKLIRSLNCNGLVDSVVTKVFQLLRVKLIRSLGWSSKIGF